MAVHPRACGELPWERIELTIGDGSSPRMRGTRSMSPMNRVRRTVHPRACGELDLLSARSHAALRFIPAHAGNSSLCPLLRSRHSVHPRACGELFAVKRGTTTAYGSSPRMRGTRWPGYSPGPLWRFIPAHAGNSYLSFASARHRAGSSPRMRGTHYNPRLDNKRITVHPRAGGELQTYRDGPIRFLRFIPAHAGNSSLGEYHPH